MRVADESERQQLGTLLGRCIAPTRLFFRPVHIRPSILAPAGCPQARTLYMEALRGRREVL